METLKPREVLYFEFVPVPTEQDGEVFLCIAVDHASEFCFSLGVCLELTDSIVLEKVQELMDNPDFKRYTIPFELVMYRTPHLEEQVNRILVPHKGKAVFDEERFADKMIPILQKMFKGMFEGKRK